MERAKSISNNEKALVRAWPDHQRVELYFEQWKEMLTMEEVQTIIALALNYCVEHEKLEIIGYLIDANKLNLIAAGSKEQLDKKLKVFFKQVLEEIEKQLEVNEEKLSIFSDNPSDLFDKRSLKDQYLIQLICGQAIDLNYHNPKLEKVRKEVGTNSFCSAIDYSGAEGPVQVATNWRKQKIKKTKRHGV